MTTIIPKLLNGADNELSKNGVISKDRMGDIRQRVVGAIDFYQAEKSDLKIVADSLKATADLTTCLARAIEDLTITPAEHDEIEEKIDDLVEHLNDSKLKLQNIFRMKQK